MKTVWLLIIILTPYGSFKHGIRDKTSQIIQLEMVYTEPKDRDFCMMHGSLIANDLGKGPNIIEYSCVLTLQKNILRETQK